MLRFTIAIGIALLAGGTANGEDFACYGSAPMGWVAVGPDPTSSVIFVPRPSEPMSSENLQLEVSLISFTSVECDDASSQDLGVGGVFFVGDGVCIDDSSFPVGIPEKNIFKVRALRLYEDGSSVEMMEGEFNDWEEIYSIRLIVPEMTYDVPVGSDVIASDFSCTAERSILEQDFFDACRIAIENLTLNSDFYPTLLPCPESN